MIINTVGSGGGGVKLPPLTNAVPADKVPAGFDTIGQDGTVVTGTLPKIEAGGVEFSMDDATGVITGQIPNGYVDTDGLTTTFEVPIVDVATPTVSINEAGLVTANVVQAKGWIKEVTSASGTMQLQVRTSDDLVLGDDGTITAPAGYYPNAASKVASVEPEITVSTVGLITASAGSLQTTHQITRADIPTLLPGNIRYGVNICGVVGTVTGGVVTYCTVTTGVSGAVVKATCGNTQQTATCDRSGVAYVYLTMAGTWTITAEHPTNGAYSTNSAKVTLQDNFPISLTVGSSTTVSVGGYRLTATLNMAYRPGLENEYEMGASHRPTYKWGAAALSKCSSNGYTNFVLFGGTRNGTGYPYASTYSSGGGPNGPYRFATHFRYRNPHIERWYTDGTYNSQYNICNMGRWGLAGATVKSGNSWISVFAGGYSSFEKCAYRNDVDAYIETNSSSFIICGSFLNENTDGSSADSNQKDISQLNDHKLNLSIRRAWLAGSGYNEDTSGYALFGGGQTTTSGAVSAVVDYVRIYDIIDYTRKCSVARGTCSNLSVARSHLAACCHLNDYILFGGGKNSAGSPVANVDAYNASRTKSTPTALSVARYNLAAAVGGGTFLLFAGGISANGVSNVVDAYNLQRVRTTPVTLSVARHDMAGFTMGEYAVFACGRTSISSGASAVIDLIGPGMVRSTIQSAGGARYGCCGCAGTFQNKNISAIYGYIYGGWDQSDDYSCEYERMVLQTT